QRRPPRRSRTLAATTRYWRIYRRCGLILRFRHPGSRDRHQHSASAREDFLRQRRLCPESHCSRTETCSTTDARHLHSTGPPGCQYMEGCCHGIRRTHLYCASSEVRSVPGTEPVRLGCCRQARARDKGENTVLERL